MKTRRLLASWLCAACVVVAVRPPAAQDWKSAALASFDDVWQTINETFPDPSFGGVDWPAVKTELRPEVQSAESADAARATIRRMLARLHRSHFVLLSASAEPGDAVTGDATVAVDIRAVPSGVVITRVTPGSPAEGAGLHAGMTLLSVDGQPASAWIAAAQGQDDRARALDIWRRGYRALHGAPGSIVALRVRTAAGVERDVKAVRANEAGQVVQLGNLPPLRVSVEARELLTPARHHAGVITFNYWMTAINGVVDDAVDRFRQHDGLVFDLRGNPGGLAALMSRVAGHVLATDAVLGRMRTRQTWDAPLTFRANPQLVTPDGRRVTPFAGPVAIVVDELTASTSECFAGGLQSLGRARIFGRASAGQALPASTKRLANGDVLLFAIGDFVTSTGRALEGEGVVPDEPQPLDLIALDLGHDAPLEAALRWIDKEKR